MFKKIIQSKLERAVKKYFKTHPDVKLVVVVGSVGKTSTKVAIGTVLAESMRVRLHEGNHNSEISAPLAMLGVEFPDSLRNFGQWMTAFKAVKERIKQPADVDVIVQELGTDRIGQIPHFGTYLKPDIAVVTAVSAEHLEYFQTLDNVAAEELAAANFSKSALINRDDIPGQYAADITNPSINTYGSTDAAEYRFETTDYTFEDGFTGTLIAPELQAPLEVTINLVGEHSTRAAIAAGAVAVKLGAAPHEIAKGMANIQAVHGRMNLLKGVDGSVIIDDTYNSSPLAAESALRTLYQMNVPQRIAVLGSMNELGDTSAQAHEELGKFCDPTFLDHVITVGEDAEKYLAPAAKAKGCHVVVCKNALEAGAVAHKFLEGKGAVLFKGSQGGVYLEEGVKVLLHSTDDEALLVRQSPDWMKIKQKYFESFSTVSASND